MTLRRIAYAALAFPLLAACVSNETMGTRPAPAGGEMFANYVAIGTSIGAGIRSGGLDSVGQQAAYPYLLAVRMGLTPGADWHWPKMAGDGCPAPYADIRLGTRLSAVPCGLRDPANTYAYMNNVGIPGIRVAQVVDITQRQFVATDTLLAAEFITGSMNPLDMALMARPTFVTLEIGLNDVLGAATRGDITLLTPADSFRLQFTRIANKIDATGAKVAVANIPNVTRIPNLSAGYIYYCLKNGCPGLPATAPFSLATFTVDVSCVPSSSGGVGDSTLVPFSTLGRILGALTAGGAASLNCATGVVTATGSVAAQLPTVVKAELMAIAARVDSLNTTIASQATTRGWALVDLYGLLDAQQTAGNIPPFPNLSATDPDTLFGTVFSQDGVHPTAAGHVLIANAFIAAINTTFTTTLLAIP